MRLFAFLLSVVFVSGLPALAEDFKLGDVKPGLEGYAVTAGVGNVLQRFNVTVLETLHDAALPLVLVRGSGKFLDDVGGIGQGFSGSPVYIGDKLLGAISGGFPNDDHRLALVTPIEFMRKASPTAATLERYGLNALPVLAMPCLAAYGGCAVPLATPLMVSGLSARATEVLQSELTRRGYPATLQNLQTSPNGSGNRAYKLEPGAPITAQLVTGDVNIGAVGTVTSLEGNRVLAFGHAVFADAKLRYLMQPAFVLGFVNSSVVPFKLAEVINAPIGLFTTDRPYGMGGLTGKPSPLPLEIAVKRGASSVVKQVSLTPVEDLAGALGLPSILSALDDTLEVSTGGEIQFSWHLEFTNRAALDYGDRVADQDDVAGVAARRAALLLALISENPYQAANLKRLSVTLEVTPYNALRVVKADAEKKSLKAGESTTINLRVQPYRLPTVLRRIAFRVPENTPVGTLHLRVRGAGTARPQTEAMRLENPDPWDQLLTFEELLERLRSRITADSAVVETTDDQPVIIGLERLGSVATGWVYVDVQVVK